MTKSLVLLNRFMHLNSKTKRTEKEVFKDLADLCSNSGYVHSLAYLCFRDSMLFYRDKVRPADMTKMFSHSRLIRTEINTLLGLMIRTNIDWNVPTPAKAQAYSDSSEKLLNELHSCLSNEFFNGLTKEDLGSGLNPFDRGTALREPIFYAAESAYQFQYLDLAKQKYARDKAWLESNVQFNIEQASHIANAIDEVFKDNIDSVMSKMRLQSPEQWSMLDLFKLSATDIASKAGYEVHIVTRILNSLTLPTTERNEGFQALNDFNAIAAYPLLKHPDGDYILLQQYSLAEAIYEAPFYWMIKDKQYQPTLTKNRGDFTEEFVAKRLELVFGSENVFSNVEISEKKSEKISDIDVLVTWGNRVIIIQAKSKRLSLEAKKGNDQVIRDDFKKAVQAAYDQGITCAKSILSNKCKLTSSLGKTIEIPEKIKEIYILCVVSDHYPALSFQSRQFLKKQSIELVNPPLVLDIFAIDAITEMLQSPLQLLSYLKQRSNYSERILASQELTTLGYHLTNNLWVKEDVDLMLLEDDFTANLDIAMAARRTGLPGKRTPDGVLTRFSATTLGRITQAIAQNPNEDTVDLGLKLLSLSEDAVKNMSRAIESMAAKSRNDGEIHDVSFAFKEDFGITFHCTDEPFNIAAPRLTNYCELRKYKQKTSEWFGLCISSKEVNVRFGVSFNFPWKVDEFMHEKTKSMQPPSSPEKALNALFNGQQLHHKIGRNDKCPCGSGLKYKKCCLS